MFTGAQDSVFLLFGRGLALTTETRSECHSALTPAAKTLVGADDRESLRVVIGFNVAS
jgi:hypothetical protein